MVDFDEETMRLIEECNQLGEEISEHVSALFDAVGPDCDKHSSSDEDIKFTLSVKDLDE
jgi:hypothetical protein